MLSIVFTRSMLGRLAVSLQMLLVVAVVFSSEAQAQGLEPCSGGLCELLRGPGYWKNWINHHTEPEFAQLVAGTQHYANLTTSQAEAILDDMAPAAQYNRHLLAVELDVSFDPDLGAAIYHGEGSLAGLTVLQIMDLAFNTSPPSSDLV